MVIFQSSSIVNKQKKTILLGCFIKFDVLKEPRTKVQTRRLDKSSQASRMSPRPRALFHRHCRMFLFYFYGCSNCIYFHTFLTLLLLLAYCHISVLVDRKKKQKKTILLVCFIKFDVLKEPRTKAQAKYAHQTPSKRARCT